MSQQLRVGSRQGRAVLAATVIGSGMVFLDGTIANVAVKHIGQDFHAGFTALQWVLNAYTLTLASLILLGGSLGDRLGRRRIFLLGVTWFALASLACAVAPNEQVLIAARAVQGIGGALLTPGSLAIISASFVVEDRAKAVGAWSGLSGVSTALGPLLGGWLVQDYSWRWAFAINVPLAAVVLVLGVRHMPESRSTHRYPHLDVIGTVLIAAALAALTYGTTRAGTSGWSATAIGITAVGVLLAVLFVLVERIKPDPLVPLGLFRDRTFNGTNLMTLLTYAALSAFLFLFVLNLQVSAGYGALAAGLSTLPLTVLMLLLSARSGALASRIGPRVQLIAGPLLAAVGLLLTLRIDSTHHSYLPYVLPGVLVFGLGLTTLVAPLTATVMSSAPSDDVGVASGVNNAISRAGGLLAVAVLPPLAGLHGEAYREVSVMVHGYRVVTLCCVGLLVLAALVITLTVSAGRSKGLEPVDENATDSNILKRIHELVAEEKHLRAGGHGLAGADRQRLQKLETELDQAWDLLRQRRAREETGDNPNTAKERSVNEVEGYLQ
ncbi:MAG: DHA2 family efflux MFS transporter permease subunit [Jatrophihabitantaceae bacterium]